MVSPVSALELLPIPLVSAAELPSAARHAHLQVAEEASAVYNVLAIIENLIEVKPAIAEQVVEKTKVRGSCTRCCCPIY